MSRRLRAGIAAAVMALAVAAPGRVVGAWGAPTKPTATVTPAGGAPGDVVAVEGDGFEGGSLVTIELCGNRALDATADCDVRRAQTVGALGSGKVFSSLTLAIPTTPCPCVVRLSSGEVDVRLPIEIAGAPVAPVIAKVPDPSISRTVKITKAALSGSGPLAAWFGLPAKRTLELVVRNSGDVAVNDAALTVTAGRGDNPLALQPAPDIPTLGPGAVRTVRVPISIDGPVFGRYTVKAEVLGVGAPTVVRKTTGAYAWGLLLLGLLLLQGVLILGRNRARDHLARRDAAASDGPDDADVVAAMTASAVEPGDGIASTGAVDVVAAEDESVVDLRVPPIVVAGVGEAAAAARSQPAAGDAPLRLAPAVARLAELSTALVAAMRASAAASEDYARARHQEADRVLAEARAEAARIIAAARRSAESGLRPEEDEARSESG